MITFLYYILYFKQVIAALNGRSLPGLSLSSLKMNKTEKKPRKMSAVTEKTEIYSVTSDCDRALTPETPWANVHTETSPYQLLRF